MDISRSSWHYKLVKNFMNTKGAAGVPNSLCPYFWAVVFRIGVIAAIALMLGVIAYGAGAATIMSLEDLIGVLYIDTSSSLTVFQTSILIGVGLVSLALAVAFAIAAVLCVILVSSISEKTYDAITNRAAKRPDGIVIAYLKAKHRKICPMITFKNE